MTSSIRKRTFAVACGLLAVLWCPSLITCQQENQLTRQQIIDAARELITTTRYCSLITVDSNSTAHARTMDPFLPDQNLVVWMATNPKSRKVAEIRRNARVTLYYFDRESQGYVTIYGRAQLVNDAKEKSRYWKDDWKDFYPDRGRSYLLIKVVPLEMEVVIVKKDIVGKSERWTPPKVTFKK